MSNYVTVDGNEAAAHVAYDFTEVAAIYPSTPWMAPIAPASDCISVSCTRWPNMFRRPCALQRSVCSAMGEDGVMG